jgi:hypothetical protein
MADVETGDIIRLGAKQRFQDAADIVNVYHLEVYAGGPMAIASAMEDFQEYLDSIYESWEQYVTDDLVAESVSVANLTQDTAWGSMAWGDYEGGTNLVSALAPQLALLSWGNTTRPRTQQRTYWGVFCEDEIQDGLWSNTLKSLGVFIESYLRDVQTMTHGLQLRAGAYNAAASRWLPIYSVNATDNPVVQRRRRIGRGS